MLALVRETGGGGAQQPGELPRPAGMAGGGGRGAGAGAGAAAAEAVAGEPALGLHYVGQNARAGGERVARAAGRLARARGPAERALEDLAEAGRAAGVVAGVGRAGGGERLAAEAARVAAAAARLQPGSPRRSWSFGGGTPHRSPSSASTPSGPAASPRAPSYFLRRPSGLSGTPSPLSAGVAGTQTPQSGPKGG